MRPLAGAITLACAAVRAAAPAAGAGVGTAPGRTWVATGPVFAAVATSQATYIGGEFDRVGPGTGPGVGFDAATAKSTGLPEVAGGGQTVDAVIADGSGGFYIGGDFTHVGGLARSDLARIVADGSVDPSFDPDANGPVSALAVAGNRVFVGGDFTAIGGRTRHRIAAVDSVTGA